VGEGAQRPALVVGDVPALGLEGRHLLGDGSGLDVVPARGARVRFGLVGGQAKDLGRALVYLGEFGARLRLGELALEQRPVLEVGDPRQVDQSAKALQQRLPIVKWRCCGGKTRG